MVVDPIARYNYRGKKGRGLLPVSRGRRRRREKLGEV